MPLFFILYSAIIAKISLVACLILYKYESLPQGRWEWIFESMIWSWSSLVKTISFNSVIISIFLITVLVVVSLNKISIVIVFWPSLLKERHKHFSIIFEQSSCKELSYNNEPLTVILSIKFSSHEYSEIGKTSSTLASNGIMKFNSIIFLPLFFQFSF